MGIIHAAKNQVKQALMSSWYCCLLWIAQENCNDCQLVTRGKCGYNTVIAVGRWRNGRRSGLKIRRGQLRVGSNPTRPILLMARSRAFFVGERHGFT